MNNNKINNKKNKKLKFKIIRQIIMFKFKI